MNRRALLLALLLGACGDENRSSELTVRGDSVTAPSSTSSTSSITTTTSSTTPSATATSIAVGTAGPALAPPAGLSACVASDLEFHPGAGLGLLRFFNRHGSTCGLAGYPTLSGRLSSGEWQSIPTTPLYLAPTNGPQWTGEFTTRLVAVISIRNPDSKCVTVAPPTAYSTLRLSLPNGAGDVGIDQPFEFAGCPLQITPFTADSQDFGG